MNLPDELDHEKLAEVALAILSLTAMDDDYGVRVWKGMDWGLTEFLYEKGWIHDPKGKQKSMVLTEEGAKLAPEFMKKHFAK
ncbi:hypothetical protein FV139_13270 [Parahaliea maris]|uniref:DUF6429 domain-containing protein n=1 Tax=Parahaliea maris TaxID=2716870 RepID=A0A5C8ZWI1_9GAMM|nr:DUF6429 family protein [Parahaliea maris]TXS92925.1 hypothetical protein FV139_13270 [Parahaliea maris]